MVYGRERINKVVPVRGGGRTGEGASRVFQRGRECSRSVESVLEAQDFRFWVSGFTVRSKRVTASAGFAARTRLDKRLECSRGVESVLEASKVF